MSEDNGPFGNEDLAPGKIAAVETARKDLEEAVVRHQQALAAAYGGEPTQVILDWVVITSSIDYKSNNGGANYSYIAPEGQVSHRTTGLIKHALKTLF